MLMPRVWGANCPAPDCSNAYAGQGGLWHLTGDSIDAEGMVRRFLLYWLDLPEAV
jgi:hypothetical protein